MDPDKIILFTRETLTIHNLMLSLLKNSHGRIELLISVVLIIASLLFINRYTRTIKNKLEHHHRKKTFCGHLFLRLIWPACLLTLTGVAQAIWLYFGYQSVWLSFLGITTLWLILIRTAMAILQYSLPDHIFEKNGEYFLSIILWLSFVFWLSGIDHLILVTLQNITFPIGNRKTSLLNILSALFWIGITVIVALWIGKLLESHIMRIKGMDLNVRIVINKISRTILVVMAVLVTLPLVGVDLTVLSVFGGAVGVGVGFGLQKIASNYISGFIILLDRSIRMGDRLVINDKITGYVTKITSRYIVLKASDGSEALVPNETLIANTVINQSYSDKSMWQLITVQVAYDTDLNQALAMLISAAEHPRINETPAPLAYVMEFADSGVNLGLGFWVKDPENGFMSLKSAVLLSIWNRFHEAGIQFPFPQREIRILNDGENEKISQKES